MPYLVRHGITGKQIGASGKARTAPFASLTIASIVAKNQSKAQGATMQVWATDANGAPEREIAWAYRGEFNESPEGASAAEGRKTPGT